METHGMVRANPVTHSGNLATLLAHRLMDPIPAHLTIERTALLTVLPHLDLTVANVHLTPGRAGSEDRLKQMERVVEAAETPHLLVVGDTNSRLSEEADFNRLGLYGEKPPAPTWNSRRNRFHSEMPEFSAYFTRCFATSQVVVDNLCVWDEARVEHDGSRFQLSDHYALSGTLTLGAA